MVKEEQQKKSRHLQRGAEPENRNSKKNSVAGGGPVPDPGEADQVGVEDPRDLSIENRHPLRSPPWRPGEKAAS